MTQNLTLSGIASQYFVEAQENNNPWNGIDDAIDDAFQAVLCDSSLTHKLVVVNIERNKIEIFDNGIGQSYSHLEKAYSNAICHGWDKNVGVGIKGVGRFKFAAICADFTSPCGSKYTVTSSVGDSVVTEINMNICKHDATLLTPTIKNEQNTNLKNNGINIINGKLKGTILSLSPCCINDTHFNSIIELYYGHKYHDNIKYDNVELIINGKKIEPIDLPHISHITDDNINSIIYNKEDKTCSVYHRIEFFHKLNENKKLFFNVKATTALCSDYIRNKYPWENLFKFNELSGVYAKFRGRYLNTGGNVGSMFKQNIDSGDTKGKGSYGDISGSYSGYNRTVIEFFDDEVAEIFGVKTVKSQGIENLSDNKKIMNDYVTYIDGKLVSVYHAICYIRKFLHDCIYIKTIKEYKLNKKDTPIEKWESFGSICNYYYNNYKFSEGNLNKGRKKTSIKEIEEIFNLTEKKNINYIICNENSFIKAEWNDESILSIDVNDNCKLCKFINDDVVLEKLFVEFKEDFLVFVEECHLTKNDVQHLLIGKTNRKIKKYKRIFND